MSGLELNGRHRRLAIGLYFACVAALTTRIAVLDEWGVASWLVILVPLVVGIRVDRLDAPSGRSLLVGISLFAALSGIVAYLPDVWFAIAFRLNHAEHYLFYANDAMKALPLNDGRFLWSHRWEPFSRAMAWVYRTGFDMVLWIPVVRSLVAYDTRKVARYALGAHAIQFPLIIPFYTAIRVDEVWCVLGDPDRCARGWSEEVKRDLGANCFPSMHTSVAFAIMLFALREKSVFFRRALVIYCAAIIFSTVYMEIHWLVDVAGGLLLGAVSVKIADRVLRRWEVAEEPKGAAPGLEAAVQVARPGAASIR